METSSPRLSRLTLDTRSGNTSEQTMVLYGVALRVRREELGLSQAKLAEVSGIPQQVLSAVELGKRPAPIDVASRLKEVLSGHESAAVAGRKKRYRKHSYTARSHDPSRVKHHQVTAGNEQFLQALRQLEALPQPRYTAVSVFAGAGGLSLGFRSAGFQMLGFVEIDDCLAEIYQANFPDTVRLGSSIQSVSDARLEELVKAQGRVDVLLGGPPCQGFSLAGKRNVDDPRNELFRDYMRVLAKLQPKVAILENVKLLTSMKNSSGGFVKDEIMDQFQINGYSVKIFEENAKNYGVPQHRERVLFVAVRNDLKVGPSFPKGEFFDTPTLYGDRVRTFGDACSDLPYIESGETSEIPSHIAVSHPDHVVEWLWDVPQGKSAHDNVDPTKRPPSGYNTTYKRQVWDEPAATVQTTFGMISGCRNVHPIATRAMTVREAARIQSFPDSYRFDGSLASIRTGIGNAVPPLLARAIAEHLRTRVLDLVEVTSL